MAWELLRRQPSQTTHLRPGTPPHGPGTRTLQPGSQPSTTNSTRYQPAALTAPTPGHRPRSRPAARSRPSRLGEGKTQKTLARPCPIDPPARRSPVNGDPPGERKAAHTPLRSKAWYRITHQSDHAPTSSSSSPPRLRPSPRAPIRNSDRSKTPNVSRTIHRHLTHFPADLQTVIISGPD